ncbi:cytochrome P450 [Leucobacter exalbidus]|uniref:Cytochrome P450 n=1 Tax=Leucobacter exalbidus TaxID=662960 RepID=A0A940PQI7_9MICO|nr:cytochrome P450 [Leucobacter exalbidus]MBP1327295.1 cytochrome P450 [Leucobacter exalbidus]
MTQESTAVRAKAQGCPFSNTDYNQDAAVYGHYEQLEADRQQGQFVFNDTTERGFYMVQGFDDVVAALNNKNFTNDVTSALNPDRKESSTFYPQELDGDVHTKFRRVLNPYFSPVAVRRLDEFALPRLREMIGEIKRNGSVNFVEDFAIKFPAEVFLHLLGLPHTDVDFFLRDSEIMLNSLFNGDRDAGAAANKRLLAYFDIAVAERRDNPGDPKTDFLTRVMDADIDGRPMTHDEVLAVCLSVTLAGLDTTRSALGYVFYYLANHDELRHELTENPAMIPHAIEEFIRMNPLVFQAGREAQSQQDFRGLDVEAGDVMWLGMASANRDPNKYPEPEKFVLDREGINAHVGFGGGPHRCLGRHLARHELRMVLEEWHKQIPNYRVSNADEVVERGGQLTLKSMKLDVLE